jgi:hypothetical protein
MKLMDRLTCFAALLIVTLLPFLALAKGNSSAGDDSGQTSSTNDSSPTSCVNRSLVFNFDDYRYNRPVRHVPVWQLYDHPAFFFAAGMTIDADGAPNAYGPEDMGLDDIANAGSPGHWDGVITDDDGNPMIQSELDPYPGYYVSCTSLSDRNKARYDPTRYVDASKIPYVVLPGGLARQAGARLGDFAAVMNDRNQRVSFAIFADVGTLGEGSIALADNLGIGSDARNGGRSRGVFYLVFPGTGNRQPRTVDEINAEGAKALADWGGIDQLTSCARDEGGLVPPQPGLVKASNGSQAPTP